MSYNVSTGVYHVKARFKSEFLRAGRRMQCLLRPGWMLADYSTQQDRHHWTVVLQKTVFNLSILCILLQVDWSPDRVVVVVIREIFWGLA